MCEFNEAPVYASYTVARPPKPSMQPKAIFLLSGVKQHDTTAPEDPMVSTHGSELLLLFKNLNHPKVVI